MKVLAVILAAIFVPLALPSRNFALSAQTTTQTPVEAEIQRQRQRLSASDPEERRDALMKLGAMRRASASRQAVVGLTDASPIVRAVATKAILSMPTEESVAALLPLVSDKDEFVKNL